MGIWVSANEAGLLVGRHERQVRIHIQRGDLPARKSARGFWQINTDDLGRVPGWVVDRERLARLELRQTRSYGGLVARVEALEARLRGMESQVRALETRVRELSGERGGERGGGGLDGSVTAPETPPDGQQTPHKDDEGGSGFLDWLEPLTPLQRPQTATATVTLLDRGPEQPREFRTLSDAARWLDRHGINALTPKSWPGWAYVERTPSGVLQFALERQRAGRGNWRVRWTLRRCDDLACVCQELLPRVSLPSGVSGVGEGVAGGV